MFDRQFKILVLRVLGMILKRLATGSGDFEFGNGVNDWMSDARKYGK